ncbi:MAG: 50S ribosomal protein L9 [Proteobacteria bacterium]|nr:50S ribosomal protein L9 [Pseudomonadota bacterium]
MEVILLERIEKLGQMGDVVRVKAGYARNFLLPQKKALRATKESRETFEKQRAQLEAQNLERRKDAEAVATRMAGLSVLVLRQAGETGHLYGSVSGRDVADAVTAAGVSIRRQQVLLDHPIKELGLHTVRIALHPEVIETVSVNVARSPEEAAAQARGESVLRREEEGPGVGEEEFFEPEVLEARHQREADEAAEKAEEGQETAAKGAGESEGAA